MREWRLKSAQALLDQGLTSAAGFLLNVLLARSLAPETYGAFAAAFSVFLIVAGFHNVLILEPATVVGPASYRGRLRPFYLMQIRLHFLLLAGLSSLVMAVALFLLMRTGHRELGRALMGMALASPFILLLVLARRFCYGEQMPAMAATGSLVNLLLVLLGFVALFWSDLLSPPWAFVLMAVAALGASLPLLIGHRPAESLAMPEVVKKNWEYGRWLLGVAFLFPLATHVQTFLVVGIIGLGAAGTLRAMQLPTLLVVQAITATSLLALPSMAADYGKGNLAALRRKGAKATLYLVVTAVAFELVLIAFASQVEWLLFGGKFAADAWLIPILGLMPVFVAAASGASLMLRAAHKPQFDLVANLVAAPVGLLSAFLLMPSFHLVGAACSIVLPVAASASITVVMHRRWATGICIPIACVLVGR